MILIAVGHPLVGGVLQMLIKIRMESMTLMKMMMMITMEFQILMMHAHTVFLIGHQAVTVIGTVMAVLIWMKIMMMIMMD